MATIFKYKENIYQCMSLPKKLKRLKIKEGDIEILYEGDVPQSELEKKYLEFIQTNKKESIEYQDTKLYYFINKKTGYSIISIYPVCNEPDYEQCTKEYLESYWNKARSV